jgi:hypothetical protein
MNIEYVEPLSRGWDRMKKALFQPFDLRKWFVVGFTAFLAGLTESHGGGQYKWTKRLDRHGWEDIFRFPSEAREWLAAHPLWAALILAAVFVAVALAVLMTWLSSRGNFMFLDNVSRDHSRVTAPWHEYRSAGNSLFIWRLCVGFAVFAVFTGYILYCFLTLSAAYESGHSGEALVLNLLAMGLGLIGLGFVSGYISLFLDDFVPVIMVRRGVDAVSAIRVFWDLFREHPLPLLAYGLIVFFLKILVVFLVVIVGFFTCCAGFLILAVPYVNAVILLPVSYTFRAFSLEFLAQFGRDFDCLSVSPKSKPARTAPKPATKKRNP